MKIAAFAVNLTNTSWPGWPIPQKLVEVDIPLGSYIAEARDSRFVDVTYGGVDYCGPTRHRIINDHGAIVKYYPIRIFPSCPAPHNSDKTIEEIAWLVVGEKPFTVVDLTMPTDDNYGSWNAKLLVWERRRATKLTSNLERTIMVLQNQGPQVDIKVA